MVGFNFWMVYVIVVVALMVIMGLAHYQRSGKRVIERFSGWDAVKASVAAGAVFAVLLVLESFDGLVQMYDNGQPSDLYAWQSPILAMGTVLLAGACYAAILYAVERVTAFAKLGYLRREMSGWQRDQSRREAKRLNARQAASYRAADPGYMRSVSVLQLAERRGDQLHRARIICDEDWLPLAEPWSYAEPRMRAEQRPHMESQAERRTYSRRGAQPREYHPHPRVRR